VRHELAASIAPGVLASVRGLTMNVDRLDDIAGALFASATLVNGDGTMVLYEISLADATQGVAIRPGGRSLSAPLQEVACHASNYRERHAERALVTGASGGIGAAICRRLASAGHFVYVHAIGIATPRRRWSGAQRHRALQRGLTFDVTDAESTRVQLETLVADAPIQILVTTPDCTMTPPFRA